MADESSAAERHLIHEVRNCLNQIQGFGDLLAESAVDKQQKQLATRAAALLTLARAARELSKAPIPQGLDQSASQTSAGTRLYELAQQVVAWTLQVPADATAENEHDFDQIRVAAQRMQQLLLAGLAVGPAGQPSQHEACKADELPYAPRRS